jgi:tRNA pseudouridine13 synthase
MFVSKLERSIGIETYVTKSSGIGGAIKQNIEDFVVNEVLVDGSVAETNSINHKALGTSPLKNRYLMCVLTKKDWDTFLAIKTIAKHLNIDVARFQIAGIKDAKAITKQYVTIEGVSTEEIAKVYVKDIEIHPLGYVYRKISPYFLLGNNFRITIRAILKPKSTIQKRIMETIKEIQEKGGIPNFFGHQRFGTTRPITHLVGKALIQGNFEKAAMIFLAKPSPCEHPESRQAREILKTTQDFKQALKIFPKSLHYERLMLRHLAKKPEDFIGAFRRLPKGLLKLFPQACQAYLFNRFLSQRIKSGLSLNEACVGDYVVNVERNGLPMLNMRRIVNVKAIGDINEALKARRVRLALPLIGFKQRLSEGSQGEIEKRILDEEGVYPEDFKIKAIREIGSKGELRTATTPLKNFSLDSIAKDSANPSKNEVKLHFMLLRGSYATVFLREIMKARNPIKAGF